ncbi:MAG: Fur family transcriptional regulator [Opitutales bacterium]
MASTQQRAAINQVLQEAGRPLTRDEILTLGREKYARLGSATVDRFIRHATEGFQLVCVHFPGQPKRYELPACAEHPHFVCRKCERVFDLPVAMKLPEIKAPKGFQIGGGEVIYSGYCPDCARP